MELVPSSVKPAGQWPRSRAVGVFIFVECSGTTPDGSKSRLKKLRQGKLPGFPKWPDGRPVQTVISMKKINLRRSQPAVLENTATNDSTNDSDAGSEERVCFAIPPPLLTVQYVPEPSSATQFRIVIRQNLGKCVTSWMPRCNQQSNGVVARSSRSR